MIVESSVSLNEKLKELLKEALQDKKNGIENQNLEYEENNDSTQEGPGNLLTLWEHSLTIVEISMKGMEGLVTSWSRNIYLA